MVDVIVEVFLWAIPLGIFGVIGYLFLRYTPYFQKTKRKVYIYDAVDGTQKKATVGWIFRKDGIEYFRVLLSGFPTYRAVLLDRSILKTASPDGSIDLIEVVPNLFSSENYHPKNPIITQRDAFVNEVLSALPEEARPSFKLFLENAMQKHSRVIDLSESRWLSENLAAKRAQEARARGDTLIREMLPYLALIIVGLFTYLTYDSLSKSFETATERFAVISAEHTKQVVEACGGAYNNTTATQFVKQTGDFRIPILQR